MQIFHKTTCLFRRMLKAQEQMSELELEDEMDERMMNMGFTNDEVDELLCQGIKPWDDEDYVALDVLYDY